MGVATTPSADTHEARLARFDIAERAVHWANAVLFGVLIATGAVLYLGPLSALVGRRPLVRTVHVYAGLALPIPFLAGVVGRWGAALRRDLGELNRWTTDDMRWFRVRGHDGDLRVGKFNAGQKLNAAFVGAGGVVMLMTGSIMKWFDPFPTSWRTGATFVHDWTALGLGLAIIGHVWFALADRDALAGMWRGSVPVAWARRHRPAWFDAVSRRETSGSG
jgi:formate dehydrogenase subunit gamma